MSSTGPVEIGWRKELVNEDEESANNRKSRSSEKKKKKKSNSSSESSRSRSSSSSSSLSKSSSSSSDDRQKKKREKKERKEKRREDKRLRKQRRAIEKAQKKEFKKAIKEKRREEKRLKKIAKNIESTPQAKAEEVTEAGPDYSIPVDLMYTKSHTPETKEEYDRRQNQIRREIDPNTGRSRLIKGDGEVLEEIVSKDKHKEINKQATKGDGEFFQLKTVGFNIPTNSKTA